MTKDFICNFSILQGLFHKIARGYIVKIPKISSHPHRLRPRVVISISLRLSKQQRTGSGSKASTGSVESSKAWSPPAAAQAAARPPLAAAQAARRGHVELGINGKVSTGSGASSKAWRGLCGGRQARHQAGGRGRRCRCAHEIRRSHLRTATMHTTGERPSI